MLTLLFVLFGLSVLFNVIGFVLELTFSLIGFIFKICFYLSPFGIIYLLLRPRHYYPRRYYW